MTDEKKPDKLEMEKIRLEQFKVWGKIITVTVSVLLGSALGAYMNWSYQNRQLDLEAMKHLGEFVDYALVKDSEKRFRFAEYFATISPSETFKKNWESYRDLIDNKEKQLIAKEKELKAAQQVKEYLKENKIEDFAERLRVAQFFADFPAEQIVQEKWREYRVELTELKVVLDEKEKMLAEAKKTGNDDEVRLLETGLALMKDQLNLLPEKQVIALQKDVAKTQAQLSELPVESDEFLTAKEAERLYLDKDWKPRSYTENKFEVKTINGDKVVIDHATGLGLTWQQSGSKDHITYDEAKRYITQLNRDKFAGYNDWRLPTLQEAITLLDQGKNSEGLFIGSEFDSTQRWIWTSDLSSASDAWVVSFRIGSCVYGSFGSGNLNSVRAVR